MTKTQINKILLKAKKSVFSEMIGNNSSKYFGEGYDFAELREYQYGDNIKKIDWNITAKQNKPYIKEFYAQRELNISIVPILSGSLHFGTSRLKSELLAHTCAILSYSAIKQGDSYTSYIANEDIKLNIKKTKHLSSVYRFVENILNYKLIGKKIDYKLINSKLFTQLKKRSLIYLIGDFFDIEDLDLRVLAKKHEVVVIILRDKFEENPKVLGNSYLIDPQTNHIFEGDIDKNTIANYSKLIKENDHKLYLHLQKCGARFVKIYTHEEPFKKLHHL